MDQSRNIVKKIIIGSLLGAAVFILMALMADYKKVASAFSEFPLSGWPFILFLSLANYAFRVIKWNFYLRRLDIAIPALSSVLVFFSGFIMAITPGKMGEVLKSLLMYQHYGVAVTRSAPAVFVERLTDVIALLIICALGVAFVFLSPGAAMQTSFSGDQIAALLITAVITIAVIASLSNQTFIMKILKFLERFSFAKKHIVHIETLFSSAREILLAWPLAYTTFLSVLAWALECYSLYYIITIISPLKAFSLQVMIFSSFAYAFSTIVGALAMVPGGLFVTEGGMALLLVKLIGITVPCAIAGAFIVRLATLWFALLIGMAALPAFNVYAGKRKN